MKRIKLVIFASELHDSASVMSTRGPLFDNLRKYADLEVIYPSMLMANSSTVNKFMDGLRSNTCKTCEQSGDTRTVCFIATGGTEEIFRSCLDAMAKPVILLSDGFHNSLAAALEISSFLSQRGIERSLYNAPLEYHEDFFENFVDSIFSDNSESSNVPSVDRTLPAFSRNVMRELSKTRIGLIGGSSSWLISSDIDKEYVSKTYGVKFEEISIDDLEKEYECVGNDNKEISVFKMKMSRYLTDDRTEEDLTNAARMCIAMKAICSRHNLNALTIKCFGILKSCNTTACLALSILNDNGIVAGCEGDIPALWTMLYAKLALGKASFMANPSSTNRNELTMDFAHCTIPISMVHGYRLPSHFESSIGLGIAGSVPSGRYRIIKISGERLDSFFSVEGDIIMNTNVPQRCRTQVRFRFDCEDDFDAFLSESKGNHIVLVHA